MFRAALTVAAIAVIAPIVLLIKIWDDIALAYSDDIWEQ